MLVGGASILATSFLFLLVLFRGCEGRDLVRNGPSNSPFDHGLRSTLDLPLPDLIESPLSKYDPGPRDLNTTELRAKLGAGFHGGFMSVSQPPRNRMVRLDHQEWWKGRRKRRRKEGSPRRHIQSTLQFPQQSHPNRSSSDGGGRASYPPWIADEARKKTSSSGKKRARPFGGRSDPVGGRKEKGAFRRRRRLVRRLLYSMTQCPIRWTWKDLGVRFWPRWIKEGRCGSEKEKSDAGGNDAGVRKGVSGSRRNKGGSEEERSSGGEADGGGSHFRKVSSGSRKASFVGSEFRSGGKKRKEGSKKGEKRWSRRNKERSGWKGRRKEAGRRKGEDAMPVAPGASCSIPPGMVCRASYARTVTLLRWHCKERKESGDDRAGGSGTESSGGGESADGEEEKRNCRWIKVEFPIVTRCACACPDRLE